MNQSERSTVASYITEAQRTRYERDGETGDFEDALHHLCNAPEPELLSDFYTEVGHVVESDFGHSDGDDLCRTLTETGAIEPCEGVRVAARMVAQHLEQQ